MTDSMRSLLPWFQLLMTLLLAVVAAVVFVTNQSRSDAAVASEQVQTQVDSKLGALSEDVSEIKSTVVGLDRQMRELRDWKVETAVKVQTNKELATSCLEQLQKYRDALFGKFGKKRGQ